MSIKHMYYRLYQGVFRVAVNFLDWTPPKIISGPGSVKKLPQVIKEKGLKKMMIVTPSSTGITIRILLRMYLSTIVLSKMRPKSSRLEGPRYAGHAILP